MKLYVTIKDAAVKATFFGFNGKMFTLLERALRRFTTLLQRRVKEKLSDDVLNVRSGNLRSSINREVVRTGSGFDATVGTNVGYGHIHEYGGVIQHPGGTAYFLAPDGVARFIRNDNPLSEHLARTQPHAIIMPERSFLRSSLAELMEEALSEIRGAIVKAFKS